MNIIKKLIGDIFLEPYIFFPSKKNTAEQNKNAIIRFFLYASIIIIIITNNYKLVVLLIILIIIVQLIGSKVLSTRKTYDKIREDKEKICRKSDINNPLGNALLYTPIEELNLKLCRNEDDKIKSNLMHNVYNDSYDLFLKKNNLRSFITMPSQTHPNDIDSFKKYLYYFDNPSCKMNGLYCAVNEDLKYHKTNYME